jgi:hypothetical protein
MARVKRGVVAGRRHKKVLAKAKGYYNARRKVFRAAKQAVIKAGQYAYRDRKQNKRVFRALWIARINAAAREWADLQPHDQWPAEGRHRGRPQGAGRACRARCPGVCGHLRKAKASCKRLTRADGVQGVRNGLAHRAHGRALADISASADIARGRGARALAGQERAHHRAAEIPGRHARGTAQGSRRAHQRSQGGRAGGHRCAAHGARSRGNLAQARPGSHRHHARRPWRGARWPASGHARAAAHRAAVPRSGLRGGRRPGDRRRLPQLRARSTCPRIIPRAPCTTPSTWSTRWRASARCCARTPRRCRSARCARRATTCRWRSSRQAASIAWIRTCHAHADVPPGGRPAGG